MRRVELDFSGVGLHLEGLTDELAGRLERDWAPFCSPAEDAPLLRMRIRLYEAGSDPGPFLPKEMTAALERARAAFELPQGRAEVDETGRAEVRLRGDLGSTTYYTLQNLLRACLAWRLPTLQGALVHAAGMILDEAAFLLVGPEGSGKSTWAGAGERRGAHVLSDDIVLVACTPRGVEALGSPLRSTQRNPFRVGRWPVRAILFPRHGAPPRWAPCEPLLARARLAANLPFVSAAIERDPRIAAVVERLALEVPCRELTFSPDPSFVDLLRAEAT